MTDLLSCPFCGGAAEVYYGVAAHDGTHAYCTECEIRTEGYKTKAGSTWDVDAAITAWNRRALPAAQPVMVSGHWKDHCRTNNGPDICDEPCRKCLAKPPFSHFAVQIKMTMQDEAEAQLRWIAAAAHVNETPKSEHDERDMLTPDAKGGDA